jgi:predicted ATP-grasp superfamily ATP-dependent carboligase
MTLKVFVCDGDGKAALAITRTLGQKGIYVVVGSHMPIGRALVSKYCKERIHYPDPHHEQEFGDFMHNYLRMNNIDVLIPVSYITCKFFSKHRDSVRFPTKIPIADWESMRPAADKRMTMVIADGCGVPRPETTEVKLRFPVVVKSDTESTFMRYVNSQEELGQIDLTDKTVYEYIPGDGYGYFALFNHGKLVVDFMHRRIREYPITGGASTFAKSVYYAELKEYGQKLFESLNWHGVGMCEFKLDRRDKKFKLIEINPKFWGSLDLAIVCGIDFPYYLVLMAMNSLTDTLPRQQGETRLFRWLFPSDILCLLADPSIFLVWLDDLYIHKICRFSLDRSDWKPELFNILMTPYAIIQAFRVGLTYPHGKPEVKT